ncbi:protein SPOROCYTELESS [Herrania umbratica]|uniref:Protein SPOROCYTELESS n=1 Tax=Herrania umbratica TaxID=108875 RepID=A0A6J1ANZ3_9ROSI|nr:protein SPOROCYTELESS [Herrania umbratica]
MATSLTLLTPNANNPTAKALEDEARPAVEFVKSNKGRKPTGKGPYQKKQPQRGMGVAQLERLRLQEKWKKMTEATTTTITTPTTQLPSDPIGTATVPVLHAVANYGVPMMINGGNGGLLGWGDTAGLVMQRVVGNGGFGGLNGQVLVGAPGSVQVACGAGVVEASKELSSMPKLQHCKPDRCDVCFKKKRCNGDNVRFNGGFNQFGQILPSKGDHFLGWNQDNNQNINEEINGFSARAARSAAAYAGQMNINETVEVVAIHRKGSSTGTGSVLMEYEFFPGKSSRSTSSKEWELPAEASVAVGGEASYANASNCVDLSLKLSY